MDKMVSQIRREAKKKKIKPINMACKVREA